MKNYFLQQESRLIVSNKNVETEGFGACGLTGWKHSGFVQDVVRVTKNVYKNCLQSD